MFALSETENSPEFYPPSLCIQRRRAAILENLLDSRIQFSFGFWGRAVKAYDNFPRKLA